jgi:hypothetical protein
MLIFSLLIILAKLLNFSRLNLSLLLKLEYLIYKNHTNGMENENLKEGNIGLQFSELNI